MPGAPLITHNRETGRDGVIVQHLILGSDGFFFQGTSVVVGIDPGLTDIGMVNPNVQLFREIVAPDNTFGLDPGLGEASVLITPGTDHRDSGFDLLF
jgi:hypothetical protein